MATLGEWPQEASPQEKAKIEEEKKNIENFRLLCRKIIQVYRIRLDALRRRHEALVSIDRNFGNIPNNPLFYSTLQSTLKAEKKVLDIVRVEDSEFENRIKYSLIQLKRYETIYNRMYTSFDKIRLSGWGRDLSVRDVIFFLRHMFRFVSLMESDLSNIERRVMKEELFLERRDPKSFNEFILAWDDEMKANENLVRHFRKVIKQNNKVINPMKGFAKLVIAGGSAVGIPLIVVGALTGSFLTRSGMTVDLFGVLGLAVAAAGFVLYFGEASEEALVGIRKDEQLLKHLEKIRAIRKPFLRRLF